MYASSRWLAALASSGIRLTAPPWRKMIVWVHGETHAISLACSP
jgi:hypothetical protein